MDELENSCMFSPDERPLVDVSKHDTHRALHVRPLRRKCLLGGLIARETINSSVKIDIRLNEGGDRIVGTEGGAMLKDALGGTPLR